MKAHFRCCIIAAMSLAMGSGCISFDSGKKKAEKYETIVANPTYDTPKAQKFHEKGLRIVDSYFAGKQVNLAEAEAFLQKSLAHDVTFGPAHNSLGIVYMLQHKYYLAAWEFEYAAKAMPDKVEPIYNLGRLYEDADKLDNAIVYYEEAMCLAPRDHTVVASLTIARMKNGESVEELRPMLEMIVFGDNRPEWIEWARDQLGRKPIQIVSSTAPDSAAPANSPPSPPPTSAPKTMPSGAPKLRTIPSPTDLTPTDSSPTSEPSSPAVIPPPPPLPDASLSFDNAGRASIN